LRLFFNRGTRRDQKCGPRQDRFCGNRQGTRITRRFANCNVISANAKVKKRPALTAGLFWGGNY
jgi:hypothetical protein